ncbi:UNVERIFIED_CONTAM: hypothetical protein Scaly_1123700 [Sesamum calycinum]|uniref:Retrotransposon Copia-like N-terminal domain-containing protein n=1 Tax=Sesamum calycinum TaxID=2727403 RepID=A0AAW2QMI6_9LAMI
MATQATEGSAAGQAPLVQHGSEVFQLLSSDHPGMILVSSPLDGKNFLAWSRAVKRALGAKMKLGFITGTSKSARTLWIALNERYGECNGPQLYQLERDIASITQGDLTIVDYFTKIQMLWDELVQLRPMPECTCGCACTCDLAKATATLVE